MSSENNLPDNPATQTEGQDSSLLKVEQDPSLVQIKESTDDIDRQRVFDSYQQGIANGAVGVEPQPFSDFLQNFYNSQTQILAITQLQQVIKREETRQELANERYPVLMNEVQLAQSARDKVLVKQSHLQSILSRLTDRLQTIKDNLSVIKQEYKTDYTLFAGIIFFAAALLFMLADFSIALSIVADGMAIGTKVVVQEGQEVLEYEWSAYGFAAALSLLAIVLKPAYDRLIEKKFLRGAGSKTFTWTILVSAVLVLVLLLTLGIFRENEFAKRAESEQALSTEAADPVQDPIITEDAASTPMLTQLGNSDEWSFQDSAGAVAIILSTALFAVAGAICLGISLPVLQKNFRIGYNYSTQSFTRRRIFIVEKQKVGIDIRYKEAENLLSLKREMLKQEVDILASVSGTQEKHNALLELYRGYYELRAGQERNLYEDGYSKGEVIKGSLPNEWATQRVLRGTLAPINEEQESANGLKGQYSRTRPFVAVRKMISQRFRRNYFNYPDSDVELYDNEN